MMGARSCAPFVFLAYAVLPGAIFVEGQEKSRGSCTVDSQGVLMHAGADSEAYGCCKLTQDPPNKPFPSLTQCYKYNTNEGACCKSGHDNHIKEQYETMLSSTCLREFTHLEFYFCLGCNAKQYDYVDEPTDTEPRGKLYVCKAFADSLFDPEELHSDSDRYDRCGLNMPVKNNDVNGPWKRGNFEPTNDGLRQVVMPFQVFTNSTQFLNLLKPPYFEDYDVIITNDDGAGGKACFNAAPRLAVLPAAALLAAALNVLLSSVW